MRLAIVDDSPVALEAVRRAVTRDAAHQVIWTARDGAEAIRKTAENRPDVILMDLIMPGTDGASATRQIMAATPCPILVVTSTVSGNYSLVYEALGAGALDAVATPTVAPDGTLAGDTALLAKLAGVSRKLRGSGEVPALSRPDAPRARAATPPVIALGASTGGPQALVEVLQQFPANLSAAVVVVQHIDANFSAGLAEWITGHIKLPVRLAQSGDALNAGTVLLGGRNDHLALTANGTLHYTTEPRDTPYRPNIDVLFRSLALHARPGVAALLTGMGRDGAAGLHALRTAGWMTFCQDESSCAVFGMPGEAIRLGAAQFVLPPAEIGCQLANLVRRATR